jgi:hypothetical protein
MCIICVQLEQERLKPAEAARNLREMRPAMSKEHQEAVEKKIDEAFFREALREAIKEEENLEE